MQVSAIIISNESKREAQLEREILMSEDSDLLCADGQMQDEVVFIAQLHRRARLLNNGFQRQVLGVVLNHSRKAVQTDQRFMKSLYCSSSAVESPSRFPAINQRLAPTGKPALALQGSTNLFVHSKHSNSMRMKFQSSTALSESFAESIASAPSEIVTCEFKEGEALVEVC